MKGKSKKIAYYGLVTSLALILAYVEALIPPIYPAIPGIKMGLPNIVIVFLIYRSGALSAGCVSLLRVLLVSVLFGNANAFMYSLAGALLSLLVMILLRKLNFLSTLGVSVAGAVAHNVGQIGMAMLLLETVGLSYYLIALTVAATVAGLLIGLCGAVLIKKIPLNATKY